MSFFTVYNFCPVLRSASPAVLMANPLPHLKLYLGSSLYILETLPAIDDNSVNIDAPAADKSGDSHFIGISSVVDFSRPLP